MQLTLQIIDVCAAGRQDRPRPYALVPLVELESAGQLGQLVSGQPVRRSESNPAAKRSNQREPAARSVVKPIRQAGYQET